MRVTAQDGGIGAADLKSRLVGAQTACRLPPKLKEGVMEAPDVGSGRPGSFTRRSLIAGATSASLAGAVAGTRATAQAARSAVVPRYTLPSGNYRIDLGEVLAVALRPVKTARFS